MFILQFFQSPVDGLVFLLSIVLAISFHEFAHAWTADRLGDDTPRLQGRVTLNPAAHLDPAGSVFFLLMGFGWGKPVIYNPMRLGRRVDELLIALAGPASNLLLALFFNVLAHFSVGFNPVFASFLTSAASWNILLASFNMIPVPPLDGSSIVAYFWPEYRSLIGGQIGMVILLAFILLSVGGINILGLIVTPISIFFKLVTHLFGLI